MMDMSSTYFLLGMSICGAYAAWGGVSHPMWVMMYWAMACILIHSVWEVMLVGRCQWGVIALEV